MVNILTLVNMVNIFTMAIKVNILTWVKTVNILTLVNMVNILTWVKTVNILTLVNPSFMRVGLRGCLVSRDSCRGTSRNYIIYNQLFLSAGSSSTLITRFGTSLGSRNERVRRLVKRDQLIN